MGVDISAIAAYGCPIVNLTDAQREAIDADPLLGGPGVELIRFDARRRDDSAYVLGVELGRADLDFGVEGLREVPGVETLSAITAAIQRHGLQTDEHEPVGVYIGGVVW